MKHRPIDVIAYDILNDWTGNNLPNSAENIAENIAENCRKYSRILPNEVKPFLRAMTQLTSIDDMYGYDSADMVVKQFLMCALGKYKTEKSEQYLNELKEIVEWEDDELFEDE